MGTVTKALTLLNVFTAERPEIGLSDMARLSGLNKATVHRLLSELQAQDMVEQTGDARGYRLGPAVLRLATLREAAVPLHTASREAVQALSEATGETAHMSVVHKTRLCTLAHAYSPAHATRVTMADAAELPFHATASGLAVLAFAAEDLVATALTPPLAVFASRTQTNPDRIRQTLVQVRQTGIATALAGFQDDVHSHAAPVFGANRQPIGALAVAAPAGRVSDIRAGEIARQTATAAQTLTRQIGGRCPDIYPLRAPP